MSTPDALEFCAYPADPRQKKPRSIPSLVTMHRKAARLSMSEVARRAGMIPTKLWKIEHGERKLYVAEVARLAQAIGCLPSDLIPDIAEEKSIHA
jgi:transcriptional regulator with XRE-family HTH domain